MEDIRKTLKLIWEKKEALQENLLLTHEAKDLQSKLIELLKKTYQKIQCRGSVYENS